MNKHPYKRVDIPSIRILPRDRASSLRGLKTLTYEFVISSSPELDLGNIGLMETTHFIKITLKLCQNVRGYLTTHS